MFIPFSDAQKKGSGSESDDEFGDDNFTSPPKRENVGRRAATKVCPTMKLRKCQSFNIEMFSSLQKVNYATLNDGNDNNSDSDVGNGSAQKGAFSSDDDDELLDNTGMNEPSSHQANLDMSDAFDSLKEDTPVKKAPVKRKLGAKAEVVKAPSTKRAKKNISDSDDSPVKVKNQ